MAIDPKYDITQPLDDPQNYSGMSSNVLFGNEMRSRPNNSMMMSRQGGILGGSNNVGMLGAENAAAQAKRIFDERQMRDRESIERLRNSIGRTEQFLANTPPPRPYTRADALIDRLRAFGTGRGGSKTRRIFDSLGRGRQMSQENALLRRQQMSDYLGSQSQLMEGYNQLSGLENQVGQDQIVANWIDTLPDAQLRALYYGNPELARDEMIKSFASPTALTPQKTTKVLSREALLRLSDSDLQFMGVDRTAINEQPQGSFFEFGFQPGTTFNERGVPMQLNRLQTFEPKIPTGAQLTSQFEDPFAQAVGKITPKTGVYVIQNEGLDREIEMITSTGKKKIVKLGDVVEAGDIIDKQSTEKQGVGIIVKDPDNPAKTGFIRFVKGTMTPSTVSQIGEGLLSGEQIVKRIDELVEDNTSIDTLLKYMEVRQRSPVGFRGLVSDLTAAMSTLVQKDPNIRNLDEDQLSSAQGRALLQGLIGRMRLEVVGGGVMTEQDALRVIQALGGDWNAFQNPQRVARAIGDVLKRKMRGYNRKHKTLSKQIEASNRFRPLMRFEVPKLIKLDETTFDFELTIPQYLNTLTKRQEDGKAIDNEVLQLVDDVENDRISNEHIERVNKWLDAFLVQKGKINE
tara:strand:+ start:1347 stop:3233 length:1887 start_codon:yes stop_codon:yes gene_type:complete